MNPGDRLQLVVGAEEQFAYSDLLTEWDADRRADGWNVLPRILLPKKTTSATLMQKLADVKPHTTLLLGEEVPWLLEQDSATGHFVHDTPEDHRYVERWDGCIGRVRFDGLPMVKGTAQDITRDYLTRRRQSAELFAGQILTVAILDYLLAHGVEWNINQMRASIPRWLWEERHGGGGFWPDVDNQDRNFEALGLEGRLLVMMFSGGDGGGEGMSLANGLLVIGGSAKWLQYKPKVGVVTYFGSMQEDCHTPDAWPRVMLTTPDTLLAFFNAEGSLHAWKMITDGWTAGEVGLSGKYNAVTNVLGDPTIMMPPIVRTANDILAVASTIPDMAARFQLGAVPVTPAVTPPVVATRPQVLVALYRRVDPRPIPGVPVSVDVKAIVQQRVNAGAVWNVHPGLADFAEGYLKELYVRWTGLDGKEYEKVYSQFAPVELK